MRRKRVDTLSLAPLESGILHEEDGHVASEVRDQELDPLETCIRQWRREWVHHVVSQLPLKYVALVQLRYFEEQRYEEIATAVNLPLCTVKAFLHKSRALLLVLLKER